MTAEDRTLDRGDIIQIDGSLQIGEGPLDRHFAIVISPLIYNRISKLMLVCPVVSSQKGWPFEVPLPESMETYGVVLVDQLRTVDREARKVAFVESATPELMMEVIGRLETLVT
ncbi:type II toxin-antitoxin system PemK/MazF family toxin [Oscillatoria sp. CS-180]|uniref:type II toxin-antitoxin system PemK/MazF family toxin n=1 Tax=Oscillatoria sp. CS-180 TaxID=3021720 RepID=UPI002330AF08|nr:type II toxin-antitoxin system PemK/MazF family toxin [Oscillatoria sp. CS-180]MDB9526904.1 type II toxin-antitoxin system PemK/MazF family toxin [Oscillatoria sp. CS-180]